MEGIALSRATPWWLNPNEVEGYVRGVFEGGGAKGVLYVGALKALLQRKLWFSAVAGSSAGAITAAMIAAGATPQEIDQTTNGGLDALDLPTTWSGVRRLNKAVGFLDRDAVLEWLRSILRAKSGIAGEESGPNFAQLFDLTHIDLFVVAVDIYRGQLAVFNRLLTPECDVADAVIASATIPLAFEPSRFTTADESDRPEWRSLRYFADGGMASNFPSFVFSDPAFREHAGLEPSSGEPLVGFLLDERSGEPEPALPYLHGKFEGTYHDWLQAASTERKYRTPAFHRRAKRAGVRKEPVWKRVLGWIEVFVLTLLRLLGRGFGDSPWPGEWPSGRKRMAGRQEGEKSTRENDSRLHSLLRSLRAWVTVAPGVLILGIAVSAAIFGVGVVRVFGSLAPESSHYDFGDVSSIFSYALLWLLTGAVTVFAVMVWLMGIVSFVLVRLTYRTSALYGGFFIRTFLNAPAAPPWAGCGPNETLVKLTVPDGITTMGVRDRGTLPSVIADCETSALAQLEGVTGNPKFPTRDTG